MKKIFSFILAAVLLTISCSSVFAAVEYYEDGGYWLVVADTVPEIGDYASVTPTINIQSTQLDSESAVQSAFGRAGKNSLPVANYDIYKVDVTLSNLGELINGIDEGDKIINAGIASFGLKILSAQASAIKAQYIVGNQISGGTFTIGTVSEGNDAGDINLSWQAAAVANPYPTINQAADPYEVAYQANGTMNFSFGVGIEKGSAAEITNVGVYVNYRTQWDTVGSEMYRKNLAATSFTLGSAAPATVDVTSVTISGATAATVGDDVQLSATVLPDNATDKAVTWTKVSGNGAVSSSGVVTATAAGDVVVKATAGGVDSANYTVSFAAPAPTPVYTDSSIDVKKPTSGTTGLTDLQGKDVTLTANYGIAKFSKDIDIVANKYFVVATDSNDVEREFEVDFAAKGVEISNVSTTFFAIVKSADHIIKSIRLKEIAR